MADYTVSGPLYCTKCGLALGLVIVAERRTLFQDRKGGALMRKGEITCKRCGRVREFNSIPVVRKAK